METNIIGEKDNFAIGYTFIDSTRNTEFYMYLHNVNVLAFKIDGEEHTTCWDLEDLAIWLRNFIQNIHDDPYPINVEGKYAANKDDNARNFESENLDELDAYYDLIDEWNNRHRWHYVSNGAILANVYFEKVNNKIEVSWDNRDLLQEADFVCLVGGDEIELNLFVDVINKFLIDYANHWYPLPIE